MKKVVSFGKLAVVAGVVGAAQFASAATEVTYTYTGETGGGVVMGIHTPDYNGGALVGQFIMTTPTVGFTSPLLTYCTDVGAFLTSPYTYTPTPISSANGVNPPWIPNGIQNVARLWAADKDIATAGTGVSSVGALSGSAIATAGLQLAIWELLYNNPLSAGSYTTTTFNNPNNGFYITSTDVGTLAAEQAAADDLNNLINDPTPNNVIWLAPTAADGSITGSQGLLYMNAPDVTSTFGLLGLGFLTLVGANRKLSVGKV